MNFLRLLLIKRISCGASTFRSMSTSPDTIGFIGLGNMGGHMANNLLKNGKHVIAYDVAPESLQQLAKNGAQPAASPAEVAAQCRCVVTMLPESKHVQQVYNGRDGLCSTAQSDSLFIDSSTIDPAVSQQVADMLGEKSCIYMDAPVSGGVNAARDAGLTFMVGGPEAAFPTAHKLLSLMGKNVVHCGAVGTGQAAKICNNMLLGISMIGTSEAMNLGINLGLDPKLLASILNTSSGRCWSSELYNPCPGVLDGVPSSNNYQGGFGADLMLKDLGLAQSAAAATRSCTPLGAAALQVYRLMHKHGLGGKDFSSAFLFLKQQ